MLMMNLKMRKNIIWLKKSRKINYEDEDSTEVEDKEENSTTGYEI